MKILRKKKKSYIDTLIAIIMLIFALYTISNIVFLVIVMKSNLHIIERTYIYILLVSIPVLLIVLIRKKVFIPRNEYVRLTNKFIEGKIHRGYIEQAGDICPKLDEVLSHFDSILKEQRLNQETKRKSEFLALQNQINPHFLYNALEAIRGDALGEGIDYIADVTEALSTFFRYSVTDTGSLVTIGDEFDNVNNYFKIQQYRFGEKLELTYEMSSDRDTLELMCPKLTLQPIVENAIFHGLEKRSEKGTITIRVSTTYNKVIITVIDDGVGMDQETLDNLNERLKNTVTPSVDNNNKTKKGGIAMVNISRRIKLLFGENYGIHVFSIPDFGTDVRITLPIVKKSLE